ncbi:MAG: phosphotransferase [Gemmatimonadetes bacterium]|jgi:Ser/Thr protein kinase RdoA (MazF antagonist)|nr:phosphotransferase [Gemmatimonadota bacterium]
MKQTVFPVHYSMLSLDALIERVLKNYNLKNITECRFLNKGLNDTYLVKNGKVEYILRVYRSGWRTKRDVEAEIELLNYLHRKKVPVSRPVRRKDGKYLQMINAPEGRRYAVLFSFAVGNVSMDTEKAYRYGKLAGTIHALTDQYPKEIKRFHLDLNHLLDEPLGNAAPFLAHRTDDLDYLRGVSEKLKAKIRQLLPVTSPSYGICHGDLHHGNVHFADENELTIFDFDCWGYGWRAYDISVFYWNYCLGEKDEKKRNRIWSSYRKGYREVRPYSRAELKAIKYFVAIRHIWLIGLHTGLAGSGAFASGFLNDGYFDFHMNFLREWIKEKCPDIE